MLLTQTRATPTQHHVRWAETTQGRSILLMDDYGLLEINRDPYADVWTFTFNSKVYVNATLDSAKRHCEELLGITNLMDPECQQQMMQAANAGLTAYSADFGTPAPPRNLSSATAVSPASSISFESNNRSVSEEMKSLKERIAFLEAKLQQLQNELSEMKARTDYKNHSIVDTPDDSKRLLDL